MMWKDIATSDLPAIGQRVLLLQRSTLEIAVATHRMDDGSVPPPDTYWDVENDQQYAIFEKWTH